ncbi:hypothetical protein [Alkalicoccobacillus plakortidis]|uniref:Cxxc_20_cxxc protein n=1 Tax=Alkalicoccobacillus plakortidis TaxID=444060 RepID=A0ABT0XF99_9BACI|nr:hypothetical protein [Alkalicoccobacillus plakortidis]MCM2674576.1 hypothetical protein [Alkalicoccobacillus plakortidis]
MSTSNRTCVHCQEEVPSIKLFFKSLLNRRVVCPTCEKEQFVALPTLLYQYFTLVGGIILSILNTNFFKQPVLFPFIILILLSCFLYEPFKKLVPER